MQQASYAILKLYILSRMEINYSTSFFPFSSSKELTSSSSMSAAGMFNFHDLGDTFQGDDANGMLGFISDQMDHQVPSGGDNPNNISHPQEKSFVHEGKGSKGGKKVRKARFAFETRSQVDILDDGYRWRKYGQKAVKNNKFPRSYYRCTHKGCNVKKQVQRLTKDEGVVVTTYEGVHSHPIQNSTDNFEHILSQMQIYTSF